MLTPWRNRQAQLRRRLGRHRRRTGACVLLAAVSVLLGGLAAVLLGFLAAMLLIDALLPVPGASWTEADDRFWRLVRERRHAERLRRLRRSAPERLALLDEQGDLARAERRPLGVVAIRLDSVTGTVEPSRARAFDARFRPDPGEAERWKRLWLLQARGVGLEPIEVYRVGGAHIVRDGHHRVSVALDRGLEEIDADVIELAPAPGRRDQAGIGSIASAP
jgi:PAS domain-containing protein